MAKLKTSFLVILWSIIGVIYSPIFIMAWFLRIIARFLLGISYFGLLNKKMGHDVIKSLFTTTWYDTRI